MCRLLLLSHAEVSKAFYEALQLITGYAVDNISYLTLPYGQNIEEYQNKIEAEMLKAKDEGILILTDLFGGSPFMISSRLYGQHHNDIPIEIVCGMNLPMVIETACALINGEPLDELKKIACKTGTEGIVDFSARLQKMNGKEN